MCTAGAGTLTDPSKGERAMLQDPPDIRRNGAARLARTANKTASKPAKRKPKGEVDRAGAIYRALRHAIIEQALEPGAKLPEDAIGERFGASRTIVRHALGRLAAEGLVELRRNRGATVATPSWDEARDIFDVRLGLEGLVVSAACGPADGRADQAAERARRRGGTGARQRRAAVDPACDRISYPARRDDRQSGAGRAMSARTRRAAA